MEAALSGLFGAIFGILLSNLFALFLEGKRRRRRTRDVIIAVHAEILAGMRGVLEQTSEREKTYLMTDPYPFGPADRSDVVFDSIRGDLSILPVSVIHEVVRYYKLVEQTNLLTEGFKDPLYAAQPKEARLKYVRGFLEKMKELEEAGLEALDVLESNGHNPGPSLKAIRKRQFAKVLRTKRIAAPFHPGRLSSSGGPRL